MVLLLAVRVRFKIFRVIRSSFIVISIFAFLGGVIRVLYDYNLVIE